MMKLLGGEHKNVCAVGDEDQSIYSWRGADIRNILEFEKDFPNARIVRLEQNYRSTQNILEAAGAVVANNLRRKGKKLWTDRQGGSLIGYYEAPDGENEALFIADRIQKFLREGRAKRRESRTAPFSIAPTRNRGWWKKRCAATASSTPWSADSASTSAPRSRTCSSYLRLVRNPHDSMALNRVINTPPRGIGETTLETIERLALETGASTWDAMGAAINNKLISTRALMALDSFRQLILDAQAMMDPDFAGKLSADVAETDADLGDAGFRIRRRGAGGRGKSESWSRGAGSGRRNRLQFRRQCRSASAARPGQLQPICRSAETAVSENAEARKSPNASARSAKDGVPQVSTLRPGMEAGTPADPDQNEEKAFRKPGRSRHASRADPLHHRPHRLHQGARNRRHARSLQPH